MEHILVLYSVFKPLFSICSTSEYRNVHSKKRKQSLPLFVSS